MSLADAQPATKDVSATALHPPRPRCVLNIGITGHRADRLTPALEAAATRRAHEALALVQRLVRGIHLKGAGWFAGDAPELRVISALAEGADRLCAQEALGLGYRLDCPLPFPADMYEEDFTSDASRAAYAGLRARADRILELPGERGSAAAAYALAGGAILGSADVLLAIWDGKGGSGPGGTADVVAHALSMGKPVIHVPLEPDLPLSLLWHGEGPAGGSWRSSLEPPAEPFDAERVGEALEAVLLPPDEAGERLALDAFLAEREALLLRRIEYPLLLAVTGAQKLKSSAWRKEPYLPATRRDWARFDSFWEGRIATAGYHLLEHGYSWADHLANRFAQSFRSGHVVNFAFSALAVALALFGYLLGGHVKVVFVVCELLLIAAIVANTRVGHAESWQQRWLDYRQLAERLRPMRTLRLLAVAQPPAVSASSRTGNRRWIDWYAGSIWRQLGMPGGRIDQAELARMTDLLLREEIEPEVAYHHRNSHRMIHVNHRLHLFGSFCFLMTVALCLGFLFSAALLDEETVKKTAIFFTVATATLPAFGTAAYGLRVQGDFAGSAARSAATADALAALGSELERHPTLARTAAIGNAAAAIMLVDLAEWRLTYQQRALEIPG
ncbi:hypothetical protein FJQ54_10645 [Sandaracinobacter neustonicus]|uniref:SMODS and SLOG-associating 2TM effector domain-containing protein n=1 Tax=Sandaracinobacter neustonicus TaxID=1715348 RepID=A0A501XJ83_9SPHN|nr:hypothetical protein [Sandaracinobacter neustonicus]TPE60459.1 hypothetical protein FJQ54_10645 [Sandaracinobacter neustonicus]